MTTHTDADHIGGHAAIINYFETQAAGVGAIYDPGIASTSQTYGDYLDAVETHEVPLYRTHAGDESSMGNVNAQVLAPPEGYLANEEANENSVVLMTQFGSARFLLTGDVEEKGEEYLVETYGSALNATVLKTGHHGSNTSSSEPFLDAASPQVAVVSSAYDSQFGHPNQEVLDRLAARSIPTYWTATHGTIVFASDGQRVTVSTQQDAPTDAIALRDGSPIEPGTGPSVALRTEITAAGDISTLTPVTTDGGTDDKAGALTITDIHADAEGTESENLNDEYIVFENTGAEALDLSGWTVSDAAGHTYTFPSGATIEPGATLTLHTGSGSDTATDRYWGSGSAVWNNGGDTITVSNKSGAVVLERQYA